jgi:hypothetical protein
MIGIYDERLQKLTDLYTFAKLISDFNKYLSVNQSCKGYTVGEDFSLAADGIALSIKHPDAKVGNTNNCYIKLETPRKRYRDTVVVILINAKGSKRHIPLSPLGEAKIIGTTDVWYSIALAVPQGGSFEELERVEAINYQLRDLPIDDASVGEYSLPFKDGYTAVCTIAKEGDLFSVKIAPTGIYASEATFTRGVFGDSSTIAMYGSQSGRFYRILPGECTITLTLIPEKDETLV